MAAGHSYNDPVYDKIEARLEKKYGLTPGLMRRIRTRGERSNADQVSEVGARTVYQIMPQTRDLFAKRYGVDAYSSIDGAAEVAALHLRDSKRRNGGSEDAAVLEYTGGPDRSKWGSQTRAYGQRVSGRATTKAGDGYKVGQRRDYQWDGGEFDLNTVPGDRSKRPLNLGPDKPTYEQKRQQALRSIGMEGSDTSQVNDHAVGIQIASEEQRAATIQHNKDARVTAWDRFKAGWQDGSVTGAVMRHLDDNDPDTPEPGWTDHYIANREEYEKDASDSEVEMLRQSTSAESLARIQAEIAARRGRAEILATAPTKGDYILNSIVSALPDPVGIVAGEGWGKALQVFGIGARAAFAEGRVLKGITLHSMEQGTANLGLTGIMDKSGDTVTTHDYVSSFALGTALGVATSPIAMRGARGKPGFNDDSASVYTQELADEAKKAKATLLADVKSKLGPDATQSEIDRAVSKRQLDDYEDLVKVTLADVPAEHKLLDEDAVTADPARKAAVEDKYELHLQEEGPDRDIMAETLARAEDIVAANPIDEDRLKPLTGWMKLASTGITLLKSRSAAARAFALATTEGTTGAGGRRTTASLIQHMREKAYNSQVNGYGSLYQMYRRQKGVGRFSEALDGKAFKEFEREVYMEINNRADDASYIPHSNPLIREAADLMERGWEVTRVDQQHVGTVGSARLGETSRGYIPHRINGAKISALTPKQRAEVQKILSEEFQSEANAFKRKDGTTRSMDKEFADKLAAKYMREAMERAKGGSHVPMNLNDPQAADMIDSALEAMGVSYPERKDMMGKFSRGGASHTKKRLKKDLNRDLGDGMKLADLYDTDVSDLYRTYTRRVSGEVALAQYGILGRKGLMEYRRAIMASGGTPDDIAAFDQVASEFLNMPFGDMKPNQHRWMENVRIAASLARLGGMGFTQASESGNAMFAVGAHRMMAQVGDMPRLVAEIRAIDKGHPVQNKMLASLDKLGGHLGMDDYHNSRLFDVPDKSLEMHGGETVGTFTRLLRSAADKQATLSGHRIIMATQVRGMAEQIVRKAVRYAKEGKEDIALDDMGIGPALRDRLRANMDKIATFKGGELDALDLFAGDLTGPEIRDLRLAIERGAGQIIQRTFIGETGKWAHDDFLKLLTQFRTFGLTSVEKQWGRNKGNFGAARSALMMIGSMSFSIPIYMARVQAAMVLMDDEQATDYYNKHMNAYAIGVSALSYTSSANILPDVLDFGTSFAGGTLGIEMPEDVMARGQSRGGFIGGKIAPGVGLVNDLYQGATSVRKDGEWNPNGIKRLVKQAPGSNLPYVAPFVNQIGD